MIGQTAIVDWAEPTIRLTRRTACLRGWWWCSESPPSPTSRHYRSCFPLGGPSTSQPCLGEGIWDSFLHGLKCLQHENNALLLEQECKVLDWLESGNQSFPVPKAFYKDDLTIAGKTWEMTGHVTVTGRTESQQWIWPFQGQVSAYRFRSISLS